MQIINSHCVTSWLKSSCPRHSIHAWSSVRCVVVVLFTRLLFLSVPLLFFQTFQTPSSAVHKKFMSKNLRDFRLGTVASNDHETPLTWNDHVHTALDFVFSNSLYCGLQSHVAAMIEAERLIQHVEIEVAVGTLCPSYCPWKETFTFLWFCIRTAGWSRPAPLQTRRKWTGSDMAHPGCPTGERRAGLAGGVCNSDLAGRRRLKPNALHEGGTRRHNARGASRRVLRLRFRPHQCPWSAQHGPSNQGCTWPLLAQMPASYARRRVSSRHKETRRGSPTSTCT